MAKTKVAKMGRPPNPIDPNGSFAEHYGWKIRNLREERGWLLEEAAAKLACSPSHLSRLERALKAPDRPTARLLDTTFATTYFTEHWQLAARDRIPPAARSLAAHWADAVRIETFMPTLVVGSLQIEAYTRALVLAGPYAADVEEIVSERLRRQQVLARESPPFLLAVMDEMALRRAIGGPAVLKDQLAWLLEAMARPNISIHVIPGKTAAYTGLSGGFTLLEHAEGGPVAYVEGPATTGRMLRDVDEVTELIRCFDFIRSAALPLQDTANLITGIMEEL
jgi:transcriptional regulator with XRE-family HTH domain